MIRKRYVTTRETYTTSQHTSQPRSSILAGQFVPAALLLHTSVGASTPWLSFVDSFMTALICAPTRSATRRDA